MGKHRSVALKMYVKQKLKNAYENLTVREVLPKNFSLPLLPTSLHSESPGTGIKGCPHEKQQKGQPVAEAGVSGNRTLVNRHVVCAGGFFKKRQAVQQAPGRIRYARKARVCAAHECRSEFLSAVRRDRKMLNFGRCGFRPFVVCQIKKNFASRKKKFAAHGRKSVFKTNGRAGLYAVLFKRKIEDGKNFAGSPSA